MDNNQHTTNNSFLDALNLLDGEFEAPEQNDEATNYIECDDELWPITYDDFDLAMEINIGEW